MSKLPIRVDRQVKVQMKESQSRHVDIDSDDYVDDTLVATAKEI
jgi:hypothetical protein